MIFITIVTLGLLLMVMLMNIIIIITIILLVIHVMSPSTALYNQNGTFVYFSLYSKPVLHITHSIIVLLAPTTTSAIRKSYRARFTDPKELKLPYFSAVIFLSFISELETWLEFHHQFCWAKNSTIYLRKDESSRVIKISDTDITS